MQYLVRNAVLNGYVDLMLTLGRDPLPVMRSAGVDPAALGSGDGWLPVDSVSRLFELSAAETRCEDFGLRLAAARGMSNLGPVGLIAREEPDVRSALGMVLRHVNLHNEALRARLVEAHGLATVQVDTAPGVTFGRQGIEIAVASVCRILRELLHDDWEPLTVCFVHDAPAVLGTHHRILGSRIQFGHTLNGIVVYARDLDADNAMSDPLLRPYTRQYLEALVPPEDTTTVDRVRTLVESLLATERCSAAYVARSLGMDRRTLHRHLARSDATFSSLVDSVRIDLAQRYVARHDRSLTDIAGELGFSALSSFSRWFKDRFGCSPKAWKAAQDSTSPAVGTPTRRRPEGSLRPVAPSAPE
ncbi:MULTISPECIES: AraC family transcriptional regulator [unclassified Rhodococcus (in: high G+C Gram-positive bacteria)]|uniref:AraC family transcriptional regulator n=1 Tax=unclassified Rhodococcus (in: high G+C Gram-positive bacteria) TaxID=192944 RepID=UPI00077A009E|nr:MULTISPECIES: AraC family transcriptional regulator [unclassified Rhodococcus (in: high G+C Gram-positive bacteria)]KXX62078.1 AraC family transcriptional regulator [Rhodococcus sp. LB1]PBC57478.1 AraC family transcriptional regulator [Rhodococcus sp. ACPA1]RZK70335.1 MAG: AraC family transcriptional regulator [Rhodococcus sp. (in: high G+C Gram-positive bacteria)]